MTEQAPARTSTSSAALALRVAGASYEEIVQTLGLPSVEDARLLVERDLASRADDVDPEQRRTQRALAVARLERLMRSVAGKATNPTDPEHLPAVRQMTQLIDRHARLLGLDAPVEVAVYSPSAMELEAWVSKMLAAQATPFAVEEAVVVPGVVVRDDESAA